MQQKIKINKQLQRKKQIKRDDKRKQSLRKKYRESATFRQNKLEKALNRYKHDDEYRTKVKLNNADRYHKDMQYQKKC